VEQRRNRRKQRAVSDHAVVSLHKYYLRAEIMRGEFHEARKQFVEKYGDNWQEKTNTNEYFRAQMCVDYWCAGIFVVVEGYEKLCLSDPLVTKLLTSPFQSKLRNYRAGTYHFREKYFDDDIRSFLGSREALSWVSSLDHALGLFLLREMSARRQRRELATSTKESY
jgi:hypothetical protein